MDCSDKGLALADMCKSVGEAITVNVRELDANSNNISVIRNGSKMIGCKLLHVLQLNDNSLNWIWNGALDRMKELKVLSLSLNQLELYKANGFYNLTNLGTFETLI